MQQQSIAKLAVPGVFSPDRTLFPSGRAVYVVLPSGTKLVCPGKKPTHAHFITTGTVSVTIPMKNGDSPEICMLGPGDVPEASELLGDSFYARSIEMRTAGVALRVRLDVLRDAVLSDSFLRASLLENLQVQYQQVDQIAACSRVHSVECRLARYLLMLEDREGTNGLAVTQNCIARALGVRRTSVTLIAGQLLQRGMIRSRRGVTWITDRKALEAVACECYSATKRLVPHRRAVSPPVASTLPSTDAREHVDMSGRQRTPLTPGDCDGYVPYRASKAR